MTPAPDDRDELVRRHLELRGDTPGRSGEAGRVLSSLDAQWWDEVDQVLQARVKGGQDDLYFSAADRLLMDAGWLDPRLVSDDPEQAEAVRKRILDLIYREEGDALHFSEWLAERWRNFLMYKELDASRHEVEDLEEGLGEDQKRVRELRARRERAYAHVAEYFENLPGVTAEVVQAVLAGRLDEHIEETYVRFLDTQERDLLVKRNKLVQARDGIVGKVKARLGGGERARVFDEIDELSRECLSRLLALRDSRNRLREAQEKTVGLVRRRRERLTQDQQLAFLEGEARLMRGLLRLGGSAAGLRHTHSVLTVDGDFTARDTVAGIMDLVRKVDPGLPGEPRILIAPFHGSGFFEWDRDTLVVPLLPVREVDAAVVEAVAHYRVLVDGLHQEGTLKRAYAAVDDGPFREAFVRDYRSWVLGVGRGRRGALGGPAYDFFRRWIGPGGDGGPVLPSELIGISPGDVDRVAQVSRRKVEEGSADAHDLAVLGALLWKRDRDREAIELLERALKAREQGDESLRSPGRVLYSLARLYQGAHLPRGEERRRELLDAVVREAPNTLWQVMAQEELSGQ